MKRQKVSQDRPISLFPHEVRARIVLAFLCIWRHRRQEQPMLGLLPRDVVRMICGWVKADFRGTFWDGTYEWELAFIPYPRWKKRNENIWVYQWVTSIGHYIRVACPVCLSFFSSPPFNKLVSSFNWGCRHKEKSLDFTTQTDLLERLQEKYILPS